MKLPAGMLSKAALSKSAKLPKLSDVLGWKSYKSIITWVSRIIYGLAWSSARGLGLMHASFRIGAAVSLEFLFILPN